MDDQLDKDLQNRIREVFDNYEDTSADEGWLQLREKFPEKQKKRAIAWIWWSAAAVLLVFLSIGLWIRSGQDQPVKQFAHVKSSHLHPQMPIKKAQKDSVAGNAQESMKEQLQSKSSSYQARVIKKGKNNGRPVQNVQANSVAVVKNKAPQQAVIAAPNAANNQLAVNSAAAVQPGTIASAIAPATNTINPLATATTTAPATTMPVPSTATIIPATATNPIAATATTVPAKKTIIEMFNEDKGQAVKTEESAAQKRIHFGVYAGTHFNYAKGSDKEANLGGGISSDIRISKNLKVVTGVSIAQNSLSYQGFPTPAASGKSNLFAPAAATSPQEQKFTALSTPTVNAYNASLVGLDIPVNLTYEFNPQKTDAYISIGLSSGTFIDESYTYKYNYPSFLSSSLLQNRDETSGNNFSGFYFAKTLDVAFGIGYPFGRNRLVIEPFLKYPLDGVGAQNLKFGAGGINLKFNFHSSHK